MELPITEMLEKLLEDNCFENVDDRECSKELIETIRPIETSLIEKAKEELRNSDEYKELKEKADKYDSLCK